MGSTSCTTFLCLPPPKRTKAFYGTLKIVPERTISTLPSNMSYVISEDQAKHRVAKRSKKTLLGSEEFLAPRNLVSRKPKGIKTAQLGLAKTLDGPRHLKEARSNLYLRCCSELNTTTTDISRHPFLLINIHTVGIYWTPVAGRHRSRDPGNIISDPNS